MFTLCPTSSAWIEAVLADFDSFLLDHAANERKASAMALNFVVRYPDRDAILEPMIQLAREELTHFHRVFKLMESRGLRFEKDQKDPYMKHLRSQVHGGRDEGFLDRLLMAGVVEARGCDRFAVVAGAVENSELRAFYTEIAQSESRHRDLFVDLAGVYFPAGQVSDRLAFWIEQDARAMASIPIRAALH
jgi:tRNA-(ms[2]io[6]A)-hydroxylase